MHDITTHTEAILRAAKSTTRALSLVPEKGVANALLALADATERRTDEILQANSRDCERMEKTNPKYDRLLLTPERVRGIANDIRAVAQLPSPLGIVLDERVRENGLKISRVSVPLGVVGIIYEARPNVTFDVAALCLRAGNVCVLKGGSDAYESNRKIVEIIRDILTEHNIPKTAIQLLPPEREAARILMNAVNEVDVLIPRGGQELINSVRRESRVPVIETGAGIVHTYIDASADIAKARAIVFNAKTRRVSVCNALDCVLLHRERLENSEEIFSALAHKHVKIFADERAFSALSKFYPHDLLDHATEEHFGTEFLDYKLAVKTVESLEEAIVHIEQYSSRHSEAIVAEDESVIEEFLASVDAAAVYANASTAFTDGAQFGLGAEIGISTQKLHARGPMALRELTSYKWIIRGNGQTRA